MKSVLTQSLEGLGQGLSTIDHEGLTRDVAGLIRGEEGRGVSNVKYAAEAPERDRGGHLVEVVLADAWGPILAELELEL